MSAENPIFVVSDSGDLLRMQPGAPPSEDALQELIARHPAMIGDRDGSLLLIEREAAIADSELASGRWSVDHLFVTRDAVPVLVEVKRAIDTRLRREVVGQMLDYAANGVAYWPTGAVSSAFANTCETMNHDPTESLDQFLDGPADHDEFWAQVEANFRAGRIKLVFVADQIPRELARIVEFLNEQMTAEVRAVELRYFEGEQGFRTLVPRIIGETERAQAQKSRGSRRMLDPVSYNEWVEQYIETKGPDTLQGFNAAVSILQDLGAELGVASTQGSIYVAIRNVNGDIAYPVALQRNGTGMIAFAWISRFMNEELRREFFDRFCEAAGPLSTDNISGFPAFKLDRLANAETASAVRDILSDYINACRGAN